MLVLHLVKRMLLMGLEMLGRSILRHCMPTLDHFILLLSLILFWNRMRVLLRRVATLVTDRSLSVLVSRVVVHLVLELLLIPFGSHHLISLSQVVWFLLNSFNVGVKVHDRNMCCIWNGSSFWNPVLVFVSLNRFGLQLRDVLTLHWFIVGLEIHFVVMRRSTWLHLEVDRLSALLVICGLSGHLSCMQGRLAWSCLALFSLVVDARVNFGHLCVAEGNFDCWLQLLRRNLPVGLNLLDISLNAQILFWVTFEGERLLASTGNVTPPNLVVRKTSVQQRWVELCYRSHLSV